MKYYTPTIEEFHVGFEFYKDGVKHITTAIDGSRKDHGVLASLEGTKKRIEFRKDLGTFSTLRVKHLDQSDIESFGFSLRHEFAFWFRGGTYVLITSNHGVISILSNKTEVEKVVFVGKIKNKSELGVILKQIGVI